MNAQSQALKAYAQNAKTTQTPRGTEYDLFARVTYRIKHAAEGGPLEYPKLVKALSDNQKLWTALAIDVADERNQLPQNLRAQIFYLSEFVQQQTSKVLTRKGRITPLLEVNSAILKGLSRQGSKS